MFHIGKRTLTTTQIIAVGFLAAIIIGTILLCLPISSKARTWTPLIDSVFMATTSICVTGLVTVTTVEHWSLFGQAVILLLIQFGGLGVVTFTTTMLLILRKRITLTERLLIQDAYNLNTLRGLVRLTKRIVKATLMLEGIGALFLAIQFIPDYTFFPGVWKAVFISVSAMCNAGIDLIGSYSLVPYQGNILVNFTVITLIVLGGIGFPVWWDVVAQIKERRQKKTMCSPKKFFSKLTLHSKVVIAVSLILILGGMLLVFLLEYSNPNTLGSMPLWKKLMASLFQSVTTRTAGFLTVPQESMRNTTSFICMILMFIGGSPSGTAGGVKTVTVAMIILSAYCIIKGREDTEIFHRKVPSGIVRKSLAVVIISSGVLITATTLLSITENAQFIDVFYETTSALATVGLSRGLTGNLTFLGKIIIIVTMYVGRIGPISLALFFNTSKKAKNRSLPEGKIMVG
ncbi:MAG: TrkH family potassium uptake protein [Velocimicrobium sp.]